MSAILQSAVDFWLADAPEMRARCAALDGKTVVIELSDLGLEICLRPRPDGLAVSMERGVTADARIRARSFDLLQMSRGEGAEGVTGRLHIEGDAELAQSMRALLRSVPFDAEERLARLIGDVPAHELGRAARGVFDLARDVARRLENMAGEYLKYERRDLPRRDEVEDFIVAVDRLRDDVERAAARLDRFRNA